MIRQPQTFVQSAKYKDIRRWASEIGRDMSACEIDEGWVSEEISLLMALDSTKDFSG